MSRFQSAGNSQKNNTAPAINSWVIIPVSVACQLPILLHGLFHMMADKFLFACTIVGKSSPIGDIGWESIALVADIMERFSK